MSELTPFDARLGVSQGRLSGLDDVDQTWAFVLGDTGARSYDLAGGDHVDLVQTVDVTNDGTIRFSVRLLTPEDVPDGYAWKVSALLDGDEVASIYGWPGVERSTEDLTINVAELAGEHDVGIRLALEAV